MPSMIIKLKKNKIKNKKTKKTTTTTTKKCYEMTSHTQPDTPCPKFKNLQFALMHGLLSFLTVSFKRVDRSTIRLAGHVDRSHSTVLKMK